MFSFEAKVVTKQASVSQRFPVKRMYNLGSATREASVAVHHQEEVARAGVTIALHIPAPRIYPIDAFAMTTEDTIGVHGLRTSSVITAACISMISFLVLRQTSRCRDFQSSFWHTLPQ